MLDNDTDYFVVAVPTPKPKAEATPTSTPTPTPALSPQSGLDFATAWLLLSQFHQKAVMGQTIL